jgi:dolichol-phosphate mannosyltransferase
MPPQARKLSIVCPAYEEEEVLPYFHRELCAVLDRLDRHYQVEVVYVDDGSKDRTLAVLKEIARSDARVRYLSLSRNFGHQAALTAGLEHAAGDVVIMMDSDLQHPPALIPALLGKWQEGNEVVLTIREEDPNLTWFKRATSRWFYRFMRLVSDTEIRFSAADFRLMSRRAVDGLLQLRESHRFLRGMVQWLGFPKAEVHFTPASRKAGVSKYNLRRLVNFALDAILSFSKVPLRVSMVLGLAATAFSLLLAGYAMVRCLLAPAGFAAGWAFLLASVYLVGGGILFGLGLVGEYVGRIYDQVKGRPLYVLKEWSGEEDLAKRQSASAA